MKFFILCFIVFAAVPALAANLFFEANGQDFKQGEEFLVSIFLNTERESVNAIEGKIIFPKELLEVKEIRNGNSIINFWIDPVRNCISNGVERPDSICFSGIIPGGYQEQKGFFFSVVFQAKASGNDVIEIRDTKVLLNDGRGTPAKITISNFPFLISEEISSSKFQDSSFKDINPPEDFTPEVASDPAMFDGKWFLVFATQDKGLGIDHYEVCERNKRKCVIAKSPYLLQNQELNQKIFVKAIDKGGNERIAIVEPHYPIKWYEVWWIWSIIILGIAAVFAARKFK